MIKSVFAVAVSLAIGLAAATPAAAQSGKADKEFYKKQQTDNQARTDANNRSVNQNAQRQRDNRR